MSKQWKMKESMTTGVNPNINLRPHIPGQPRYTTDTR